MKWLNAGRAFFERYARNVASAEPEVAFERAIAGRLAATRELARGLGILQQQCDRLAVASAQRAGERDVGCSKLSVALAAGDDAGAIALIARRQVLDAELEALERAAALARAQADEARSAVCELQAEVARLRAEREALRAREAHARTRLVLEAQRHQAGPAERDALAAARDGVERLEFEVEATRELRDGHWEGRFRAVDEAAALEAARAELEALKRRQRGLD